MFWDTLYTFFKSNFYFSEGLIQDPNDKEILDRLLHDKVKYFFKTQLFCIITHVCSLTRNAYARHLGGDRFKSTPKLRYN